MVEKYGGVPLNSMLVFEIIIDVNKHSQFQDES